jgi:hypothetical protein
MVQVQVDFDHKENTVIEVAKALYKLETKEQTIKKLVADSRERIYKILYEGDEKNNTFPK